MYWQEADFGDVEHFPYRSVSNDPDTARQFAGVLENDPVVEAVSQFKVNGESLEEFAESHESTALVVVQDGRLLVESYFGGCQRESLQPSFSCTKSIVSLLVGIAIEEGLIGSVEDPITTYVEGLHSDFDNVTIRHLMTMTSGISDTGEKLFGAIPAPWSDEVKAYYDPNCRKLARSFKLEHAPGERFEYHDFNPILVGMMLENATNATMSDYLSKKIWRPSGMSFGARWSIDSRWHGFEKPEAGLNAPAIDLARLGATLVDPQQKIVPHDWLAKSVRDPETAKLIEHKFAASAERARQRGQAELAEHIASIRYGYYWWGLERAGRYDFYANGNFGQFIYISPQARLVIVRNGTGHGGLNDWHFGNVFFGLASKVIAAQNQRGSQ